MIQNIGDVEMGHSFTSLWCTVFFLSLGGAAAVTIVNGILGRSVLLNATDDGSTYSYIQWDFNGYLTAQYSNTFSSCTGELTGRCQVYHNGSLRIDRVSYNDEGNYTLNTPILGSKTTNYQLRVYGGTSVNGSLGGSVLLNVTYEVAANSLIQWNFNSILVAQYINSSSHCTGQLAGRCRVYHNGSLGIDNVSYYDEGNYTLSTQILGSSAKTTNYQLRVYGPLTAPVLRSNVTSDPIISGTYVTLECDAGNQNVTTYNFYWGRYFVCSNCRGSFLDLRPITEFESGYFTCTIQNPFSKNTSNTLSLNVVGPISNVVVTSNISGLVWPGIDSISLRCAANARLISYSWILQGATISTGNRFQLSADNSTLTISPVTTSDNGTFICTATNVLSSLNSSEVKLNLASPVSAVTLVSNTLGDVWSGQDSASLFCSAQGSAIKFSWRLNGNPVSPNPPYYITQSNSPPSSNLIISPVSKIDAGLFTCTASNRENSETSTEISLSMNWFPDGNILCTAESIDRNIQLGCSWLEGKPAANVTLRFNNREYKGTEQVFLNVTSYINWQNLICYGNQLEKTSVCALPLEPPNSPDSPDNTLISYTEGDTAVLTTNLSSGYQSSFQVLPAQFSWFRDFDNSPIQTGGKFSVNSTDYASTLKIDPVYKSESGIYKCIARNIIGRTTFLFYVEVSEKYSPGLDGGQTAGIVIGVLAGVVIILTIVFFILKKN
ncbi:carcinoembryonic antigen-related cell adhesion molecule 1-like isoform X2 [Hyla sarda]|uniref:carcinoembryonic antigen-related cell adhesion molecule 1-like isoform X2 n=1 Tax=Hyla sarda TaxID=327740 RepID=UPI0024C3E99B|nr:carcinoembryonic antigen-related cell adhesion molecule 1-like isoform X2 [Hyla sarda]XP_056399606.1 carcinoembryonic antigen-related cell adhesion molecule 1-like isoform X2 [Hyla sarda]